MDLFQFLNNQTIPPKSRRVIWYKGILLECVNENKSSFQIHILLINIKPISDTTLKTKKEKILEDHFCIIIEVLAD